MLRPLHRISRSVLRNAVTQSALLRLFSSHDDHRRNMPDEGKGPVPGRHNQIDLDNYDIEENRFEVEDEEEETGKLPWRTILESPARAKWRAANDAPPEYLFNAQGAILEQTGKSRKQMRHTYKRILAHHSGLAFRRERERQKASSRSKVPVDSLATTNTLQNEELAGPIPYTPELTLSSLHQRLLPNYAIITRVLEETKGLLGPKAFQPQRVIDFGIGCGSASVAALDAFDSINWIHGIDPSQSMRDCAKLIIEDIAKTRTPSARVTLGESLTADASSSGGSFDLALVCYTATELPHVASALASAAALWEKLKPNGLFVMIEPGTPDGFNSIRAVRSMLLECCPPEGKFDEAMDGDDQCHIIAPCTHSGNCPMERHPDLIALKKKQRLKPDVITVEGDDTQGTKWTNAEEYYVQEMGKRGDEEDDGEDSWHLVPTEERLEKFNITETDSFETSFCSFVHTIPGASGKGEKISYFVAQKRISGDYHDELLNEEQYKFSDVNVVELLRDTYNAGRATIQRKQMKRAVEEERHWGLVSDAQDLEERVIADTEEHLGLQLLRGDKRRSSFGRIIRAPIKKKGHILVDYCSGDAGNVNSGGRIIRHKVSKGFSARVVPGQFQAARKSRWGGLWPDVTSTTLDLNTTSTNKDP